MKRNAWRALAGATFALVLAAPAAAADEKFCTQIQAIVADASNGFAALQGQRTKQEKLAATSTDPAITVDHYTAGGTPDGATACEIRANESADSSGRRYPGYSCDFPLAGTDKGAATRKLATRVAACLPGFSRPIGPGLNKDGGLLTAHANDWSVNYSVLSGPATATVGLAIRSSRK
jgi:hypothetical protein